MRRMLAHAKVFLKQMMAFQRRCLLSLQFALLVYKVFACIFVGTTARGGGDDNHNDPDAVTPHQRRIMVKFPWLGFLFPC